MTIQQIPCGPYDTNSYVLSNEAKQCIIVDAPPESFGKINKYIQSQQLKPLACVITHAHWDHMLDAWQFQASGIPVYAHQEGNSLMVEPESMAWMAPPDIEFHSCKPDGYLKEGPWTIGEFQCQILYTPGHCPGSVCLYLEDQDICCVGDLIFMESVGRSDFPGGDKNALSQSILRSIFTMADNVRLYPGHGPETTVGHEKTHNPFIRAI